VKGLIVAPLRHGALLRRFHRAASVVEFERARESCIYAFLAVVECGELARHVVTREDE